MDKAVSMVRAGEARVRRGMNMVLAAYPLDFRGEVEEIGKLQEEIDGLEEKLRKARERGRRVAKETDELLGEKVTDSLIDLS